MKKWIAVLAVVTALGIGLAAYAVNCDTIDDAIAYTMQQYGPIGVSVNLMIVTDTHSDFPPYEWVSVTVAVAPVVPDPEWRLDTWYFGGIIHRESHGMRLGIRMIDQDKLLPCSEIVKLLPPGFRVDWASCELFWPVVAELDEPIWVFQWGEAVIEIGAYTGKIYLNQD